MQLTWVFGFCLVCIDSDLKNTMSQVVDLNNGALAHFLAGDYDNAIRLLLDAINTAKCSHQVPTESFVRYQSVSRDHRTLPIVNLSIMPGHCVHSSIVKGLSLARSVHSEPLSSEIASQGAHSMYNRAYILSEHQDSCSLQVKHQQSTCGILLYNIALMNHNIGIHWGVSAALSQALRLYQASLESLDDQRWRESIDIQKVKLAILNNMGNIHAHLFQFEKTQKCLHKLRLALFEPSTSMVEMLDEDITFFFLNSLFQGKELLLAPAA